MKSADGGRVEWSKIVLRLGGDPCVKIPVFADVGSAPDGQSESKEITVFLTRRISMQSNHIIPNFLAQPQ